MRASIVIALLAGLTGPAVAQQRIPGTGVPAVSCGPSNNSMACQDLRQAAPGGSIPGLVAPRLPTSPPAFASLGQPRGDMQPKCLIPPSILRLLNDRRIDPFTRSVLLAIAGKPNEEWTLADMQMVTSVVPALTEMNIATAKLSELYEFLGLDPVNLFEPQIGSTWQISSTLSNPRAMPGSAWAASTCSVTPNAIRPLSKSRNCWRAPHLAAIDLVPQPPATVLEFYAKCLPTSAPVTCFGNRLMYAAP